MQGLARRRFYGCVSLAHYFTNCFYRHIKSSVKMKKKNAPQQRIKVQLDQRTTVMLNKLSSLKVWKVRYPFAKIIQ